MILRRIGADADGFPVFGDARGTLEEIEAQEARMLHYVENIGMAKAIRGLLPKVTLDPDGFPVVA